MLCKCELNDAVEEAIEDDEEVEDEHDAIEDDEDDDEEAGVQGSFATKDARASQMWRGMRNEDAMILRTSPSDKFSRLRYAGSRYDSPWFIIDIDARAAKISAETARRSSSRVFMCALA